MYAPLAITSDAANGANTTKVDKPAAIGDKQLVYMVVLNTTAAVVSLGKAGEPVATSPAFPVGAGEAWMAGPVLGDQIESWGLGGAGATGINVMFLAGNLKVDARSAPLSVHDEPTAATNVGFTWQQLF